jgi:anthranilate synthase/aminodeoxychorismate synthase-like glutamine amidotransferase
VRVVRNDEMSLAQIIALGPAKLIISPGPGDPTSAGVSVDAIKHFAGRLPLLGVCLGHQALGYAYGANIVREGRLMHGKTSPVHHDARTIFAPMPQPFAATRYHSLTIERASLSDDFEISAWTVEQEIMGVRHKPTGAEGVQFHPESILTQDGRKLLEAFIKC